MKYRHELKYPISYSDCLSIRQRLKPVMSIDPHANETNQYIIRSIYFDNYRDTALREKIDGIRFREKFRIRYYNDDLSFLTLEKKIKNDDLCLKLDAEITEEECRSLLAGDTNWMANSDKNLVRELYCKMKSKQLKPRVLVSYIREPYVYAPGNVRITFDSNVRTTLYRKDFLNPEPYDIDAMDEPGEIIMEVKFDEFIPEIIQHLIQTDAIRQSAFSKYGACRRFG